MFGALWRAPRRATADVRARARCGLLSRTRSLAGALLMAEAASRACPQLSIYEATNRSAALGLRSGSGSASATPMPTTLRVGAATEPTTLRVGVLYSGAFIEPNVERTWASHVSQLIEPHRIFHGVFVYLTHDQVRLASEGGDAKETARGFGAMSTRRGLPSRKDSTETREAICKRVTRLMGSVLTACEVGRNVGGSREFAQYLKLHRAFEMAMNHERASGHRYELLVRARLDMYLHATVPLPYSLRRRPTVWSLATLHRVGSVVGREPWRRCCQWDILQEMGAPKEAYWYMWWKHQFERNASAVEGANAMPYGTGRYKFYQADHLLVFDREAASRFIPSFWRVAKDPTHYLENTPGGSPEWQLFSHLGHLGIDVRLLDLRHTDRLLSFDSWRYEDTKAQLRAAEIATHCVSRHGGGGSLVRPPKRSSSTHHDVWSPAATPSRIRHAAKARGTSTARPCGRGRGRPCR